MIVNGFPRGAFSLLLVFCICISCSSGKKTEGDAAPDNTNQDLRIAIVGAGASGLTAAKTLKSLGFGNIVIFEKENRPGGRVHSYEYQGKVYELGAVWLGSTYDRVLELAKEYDVAYEEAVPVGVYDDGVFYNYDAWVIRHYNAAELLASFSNLWDMQRRFPSLKKPGFSEGEDDLHLQVGTFAPKYRIEIVTDVIASFITGSGYRNIEEVPAQYPMKLVQLLLKGTVAGLLGMPNGVPMSSFTLGGQELWRKVAADFTVRYGAEVTGIVRQTIDGKPVIQLTAGGTSEEFDRVVITASPDVYENFLDLTPSERDVFSRVKTYRYAVTLFEGANIPHGSIAEHLNRETIGGVNYFGHYHPEKNVFTAYQFVPESFGDDEITAGIIKDVEAIKGTFDKVVYRRIWSCLPYFSQEDLDQGVDEKIDSFQGTNGTYYVGSLLNSETVENTIRFSRALMERHFVPPSR